MSEARYLRAAICSLGVADRYFNHFQIELGGAEDQIEISERVEISEIGAVSCDIEIVRLGQHFGTAQRVGETLVEEPGK